MEKTKMENKEVITRSQVLPASKEKVWQLISSPGMLTEYHSFVSQNPVEKWPGVGSKDRIHYFSGLILEREFTAWIDGVGYDLNANTEEGLRYQVFWRITSGEDGQAILSISIKPYSEDRFDQYSRLLGKYLEQVLKGCEYYLRTGEPVSRNQFGSHRFFSPPVPLKD